MNATAPRHRLEGLDALRGAAALSVMFYHYTLWYEHTKGGHIAPGSGLTFGYGCYGVQLFFIISGFVIFLTLERASSVADFLVSRVARLYPGFLAAMAFTLIVEVAAGEAGAVSGFGVIAANLTMAPELFGAHKVDGSYWSLLYELDFYLLASLTLLIPRARVPEVFCGCWLAVCIGLTCFGPTPIPVLWLQLTSAVYAELFIIGVLLYRVHTGRATIWTWIILLIALEMTMVTPHRALRSLSNVQYTCLIAAFSGLVWMMTTPSLRIPIIAPLRFFGRISYPLYLIHQEVGLTLIARMEASAVAPDFAIFLTAVFVTFSAWAISTVIEYPAQRWTRDLYRRWRTRRSLASGPAQIGRSFMRP